MPRIIIPPPPKNLPYHLKIKLNLRWELSSKLSEYLAVPKIYLRCNSQDVTEGIVKLWQPKVNAKKFILFIEDLNLKPDKYLSGITETKDEVRETKTSKTVATIESQYQTVKKNKTEPTANFTNVEELLKKLVPAKSFLYRNQQKKPDKTVPSYVPMDGTRKPRKFFRLSSYEYPNFDLLSMFSKQEAVEDRGYYSVKSNTRYYIQKSYRKQDSRTKYKSLQTPEELNEKLSEDHFYEDLCYNDIPNVEENKTSSLNQVSNVKPCLVKLQELFQSFKMPFSKKPEVSERDVKSQTVEKERDANLYENAESISNMYDSVHVKHPSEADEKDDKHVSFQIGVVSLVFNVIKQSNLVFSQFIIIVNA